MPDVPGRCSGNVLARRELDDFIFCGIAEQSELLRIGSDVGEQAENVLRIELLSNEGACDVDTALNFRCKDGGIDRLCLRRSQPARCKKKKRSGLEGCAGRTCSLFLGDRKLSRNFF